MHHPRFKPLHFREDISERESEFFTQNLRFRRYSKWAADQHAAAFEVRRFFDIGSPQDDDGISADIPREIKTSADKHYATGYLAGNLCAATDQYQVAFDSSLDISRAAKQNQSPNDFIAANKYVFPEGMPIIRLMMMMPAPRNFAVLSHERIVGGNFGVGGLRPGCKQ